jgi:hypothetical protein
MASPLLFPTSTTPTFSLDAFSAYLAIGLSVLLIGVSFLLGGGAQIYYWGRVSKVTPLINKNHI